MQHVETPKKDVKTTAKAIEYNANDTCRFCPFTFHVKYGKFGKPSWENLYKTSTKQEYNDTTTLSKLCEDLGFIFPKSSKHSDRICKPCGRSLRRTHAFYQQLKSAFAKEAAGDSKENEVVEEIDNGGDPQVVRCKRGLPTTISPERRSLQKRRVGEPKSGVKKSLAFRSSSEAKSDSLLKDTSLSDLSINELLGNTSTQVKVLVLNPNQVTETKSNFSEESKSMILNITRKKWQTVANVVFKHPELKEKLLKPLQKVVEKEFTNYCKDSSKSILLAKSPKEVAEFTSKKLLEQLQLSCPYWSTAVKGASGVYNTGEDSDATKINALALSSAVVARARNHKMSALAYRMSTILFHSGAKSEDISRMNKLGVCMSPDSTVEFQRKMGENCRSKVLKWKSEIEVKKLALLLLEEVRGKLGDEDTAVAFTHDALRDKCKYFTEDVYKYCKEILLSIARGGDLTNQTLSAAINQLKASPLPEYK